MIQLTRLNNQSLIVNCDLIKFVETAPDTVLTLVSGEKILVRETPQEVLRRILDFRHDVIKGSGLRTVERQQAGAGFTEMKGADLERDLSPSKGSENG